MALASLRHWDLPVCGETRVSVGCAATPGVVSSRPGCCHSDCVEDQGPHGGQGTPGPAPGDPGRAVLPPKVWLPLPSPALGTGLCGGDRASCLGLGCSLPPIRSLTSIRDGTQQPCHRTIPRPLLLLLLLDISLCHYSLTRGGRNGGKEGGRGEELVGKSSAPSSTPRHSSPSCLS